MPRLVRRTLAALTLVIGSGMVGSGMIGTAHAQIDPVPVIVTYELKKQGQVARAAARNPKGFWIRQIVAQIEGQKPKLANLPQVAVVQITFVVGRDGHLVSKALAKSSGVAVADKSAIAMLERAQPFPPMPEGLQEQEMTFDMPVRFR